MRTLSSAVKYDIDIHGVLPVNSSDGTTDNQVSHVDIMINLAGPSSCHLNSSPVYQPDVMQLMCSFCHRVIH